MIRNRNMVFGSINDDSHNDDKYLRIPKVAANANAPTASTDINGSLYYDNENGVLYVCKAGSWVAVTTS